MRLPPALLAAPLLAPLLAASAAAEPVAALRVDLPEGMSLRTRLAIEREAGEALSERDLSMITPGTSARKLRAAGAPSGCESGPCLSRVGEALGVRAVLIVEVDGVGDTYEIRVHARAAAGGGDLANVVERCDECSTDEVGKAVRFAAGQAADAIVKALPPLAPAPPAAALAPIEPAPAAST